MVNTCSTCKHWAVEHSEYYMGLGVCKAAPMLWDACAWNDAGERIFNPDVAHRSAFVQDSSDYKAELYTRPTFGCTQYETRRTPHFVPGQPTP